MPPILKNPFADPTPTEAASPVGTDPHKSLKRWQLEAGRKRKRHDEIANQLDMARQALGPLLTQKALDDDWDATAIPGAIMEAQGKIKAWEAAEQIAQQQVDEAEKELKNAADRAERDALHAVLIELHPAGLEVDAAVRALKQALSRACPLMDQARGFGDELVN